MDWVGSLVLAAADPVAVPDHQGYRAGWGLQADSVVLDHLGGQGCVAEPFVLSPIFST